MRRISSLPTAEFCPKVDRIGLDVETTQSARGTMFHAYCATGNWPEDLRTLPEADIEEISKWRIPIPFVHNLGGVIHALQYPNAIKESLVAVDKDFNHVEIDPSTHQSEIADKHPNAMIVGHIDMAWVLKEHDLVIICDIKSSIYSVKDRCESLQLHGYGMAMCAKLGVGRYVTSIWDASEGEYHVSANAVEVDSFEAAEIRDRIRLAATERDGEFRVGTHCSGCWKRSHCPAHLVDVPEGEFKAILSGQAVERDVRGAIVKLKQIADLQKRVQAATKDWVRQHGPVRSEDGKKWYRCEMRGNRGSLNEDAVAKQLGLENLDGFRTKGEHEHFDWRKVD